MMGARARIPDQMVSFARQIAAKRRDLARQLKMLPTNADLAAEIGCSERWLTKIVSGHVRRKITLPEGAP
jgi:hypothetical protein